MPKFNHIYYYLDPIFTDVFDFIFLTKAEEHEAWMRELNNLEGFVIFMGGAVLVSFGLIQLAKMFSEMDEEERQERERQRQEEEEERRQREWDIQDRLDNQPQEPPA